MPPLLHFLKATLPTTLMTKATLVFIEADHNDKYDDNSVPMLGLESPHDRPRSDGDSIVERVPVLRLAPLDADYNGTFEPIEAAGMLIDCDLMRYKDEQSHQTSVRVSSKLS